MVQLIKLCVGIESAEQLAERQKLRHKRGERLVHSTRSVPRRRDELLKGGSLYWVIKGFIQVRQPLADIIVREEGGDDGAVLKKCDLVFEPKLIAVRPTPRRAFQGWRYLEDDDCPADLGKLDEAAGAAGAMPAQMPPKMRHDLMELGLL